MLDARYRLRSEPATMSDDSIHLVSQANPTNHQHQQMGNGYPPKPSHGNQLDPFFDDEDDYAPDSALGGPPPLPALSRASGMHLTKNTVLPAGAPQP